MLAPHLLQVEQPHEHAQQSCMQVPQSFPDSTHTLGGSVPRQHTVTPHCLHTFSGQCSHTGRYHSVLLALHLPQVGETLVCIAQWVCEAAPRWITLQVEGWLGPTGRPREPGWSSSPLSMFRGGVNNGAHQFLWSCVVPSAAAEHLWFPDLLYMVPVSGLLCRSCSIGSQWSLWKNCSQHRSTFDVFLEARQVPTLSPWTCLSNLKAFDWHCIYGFSRASNAPVRALPLFPLCLPSLQVWACSMIILIFLRAPFTLSVNL